MTSHRTGRDVSVNGHGGEATRAPVSWRQTRNDEQGGQELTTQWHVVLQMPSGQPLMPSGQLLMPSAGSSHSGLG